MHSGFFASLSYSKNHCKNKDLTLNYVKGAGATKAAPAVRDYRRIMQLIKKAKALNIAATSTVTSKTEFLKVNIVFSKLNPEPAQGINRKLNVQGHGRHRRDCSPTRWIVVSSSITDSRVLNH